MFNWFKKQDKSHNRLKNTTVELDVVGWCAPLVKVGDFIEYKHKATNTTYFLFVVELTPNLIRLGCGDTEMSYKIDGNVSGYNVVNDFIKSRNIKKLF